ncbi:MAG: hypothetical protein HC813_01105 [Planctomycetes bacterium]|nr:hypothetical protein [Planctomycetota bacterium]
MLEGFAGKEHAYRGLMEALAHTLRRAHGAAVPPGPPKSTIDCVTTCALHGALPQSPPAPANGKEG